MKAFLRFIHYSSYSERLVFLLGLALVYLIAGTITRLVFFVYNITFWSGKPEILLGFLMGIRLDLATVFLLGSPFFLILALPFPWKRFRNQLSTISWVFGAVLIPILFVNFIDVAYYPFAEKRITYELFALKGDVQSFSMDVLLPYLFLFLTFLAVALLFLWMTRRMYGVLVSRESGSSGKFRKLDFPLFLLFLAFFLASVRGFGVRPIRPASAFVGTERFTGHVATNTAYNMLFSLRNQSPPPIHFLPSGEARNRIRPLVLNHFDRPLSDQFPFQKKSIPKQPVRKKNIVLIVLESFNGIDNGILNGVEPEKSLTPGFDALARNGLLFTNYYSNARRSIEAFPAILSSLPDILSNPIIGSDLENNSNRGLGSILKEAGYTTVFYHGGRNGSMGLDQYSRVAGIENYVGLDEYEEVKGKGDYDGHWGIYDHRFFDFVREDLVQKKQPFFATIFSLSNHHPYIIPPGEIGDSVRNLPVSNPKKTLKYSDAVVFKFIRDFKKSPAFQNTIFLITADHNTFEPTHQGRTLPDLFHVPFLIYAPGTVEPGVVNRPGSHADILPTVVDLLHLRTVYSSTGRSLLEENGDRCVIFEESDLVAFIYDREALITGFQGYHQFFEREKGFWEPRRDEELKASSRETLRTIFLSYYQELQNAIVENRIYDPLLNQK